MKISNRRTALPTWVFLFGLSCQSGAVIVDGSDVTFTFDTGPAIIADDAASCVGADCFPRLCAPCRTDADCGDIGAHCLDRGDEGRFCGAPCSVAADCPEGYRCGEQSQCEPSSGVCTCTGDAVAAGLETDCARRTDAGVCMGVRSCAPDGLTECSASAPTAERCNALDDDCDGQTDEGFSVGDACNAGTPTCTLDGKRACSADGLTANCVSVAQAAPERCNGEDDDCDFLVDEDFDEGEACVFGVGACQSEGSLVCDAAGTGVVCDAAPGAPADESCNALDDDCDGVTDEGCDDDGDGYCDAALGGSSSVCAEGPGDCDDADEARHPGVSERCDTAIDDDCDGSTNDPDAAECIYLYADGDDDGAGAGPSQCQCVPDAVYSVTVAGDCDDANPLRSSIANERCDTPFDDDCSGVANEPGSNGCIVYYRDNDGDGSGVPTDSRCLCAPSAPYTAPTGGDCDDSTSAFGPLATEACDGLDNDCDGVTDAITRPCATGCGSGQETCTAGTWAGCTAAPSPCTGGPCCDSCGFLAAGTTCSPSPLEERTFCAGTCGGTVRRERRFSTCSGASSICGAGADKWVDSGVVTNCAGGAFCQNSGSAASCVSCANGCADGACITQPVHTVCVDAGYGGTQPGPVSGALQGKDITLSIALHLKGWLESDTVAKAGGGNWKVVMTRTTDVGLTPDERANACAGAEVILSVMANACGCTAANGGETYYLATTSETFATEVQAELVSAGGLKDRGTKTASYTLLQLAAVPAVATFVGFVDGDADSLKLASDAWRKGVAKGFLYALQTHFGYAKYTPP